MTASRPGFSPLHAAAFTASGLTGAVVLRLVSAGVSVSWLHRVPVMPWREAFSASVLLTSGAVVITGFWKLAAWRAGPGGRG